MIPGNEYLCLLGAEVAAGGREMERNAYRERVKGEDESKWEGAKGKGGRRREGWDGGLGRKGGRKGKEEGRMG